MLSAFAIILHLLAINIWVGGTFFSVVILAPALSSLSPDARYPFIRIVLKRFFFWVWLAFIIVIGSGGWMIYHLFDGIVNVPTYVLIMMGLALLMVTVFLWIYFGPYRLYLQSFTQADWVECEQHLAHIRLLGKINMVLGLSVLLVIGGGPYIQVGT